MGSGVDVSILIARVSDSSKLPPGWPRSAYAASKSGFKFTYRASAPVGARVVSVQLADNTPIANDATTYTLTTVDFVNEGGDGYTMLADGQGTTRDLLANVVLDYIVAAGTITPTTDGRITQVP